MRSEHHYFSNWQPFCSCQALAKVEERASQYQTKAHAVGRQWSQYIKMLTWCQAVQKRQVHFVPKMACQRHQYPFLRMLTTISVNPKEHQTADKGPHPNSNPEWQPVRCQPTTQPGHALNHTMNAAQSTPHARIYTSSKQASFYTCMGR